MSGTCVPLCFGGTSLCGTTCVDTSTDLVNCGSCDHACLGNETCIAGNCVSDTLAVGLLAYWRFDEGSGLVVLDSSGNGNHGALLTPSTSPTRTTGKVGGALNFDGINDYVNVGVRPGLTVSQALTVIAWIRPSTYSTRNVNGGIIINNEGMYEISLSTAGIDYAVANTYPSWSGFWLRSGYLPPLNEWTHIAWSYSATNGQYVLYANGAVVDTQSGTGPIGDYLTSLNEFWIGARQEGWEQWFPGVLDDIRIYNRALSLGEVQTLYDATR